MTAAVATILSGASLRSAAASLPSGSATTPGSIATLNLGKVFDSYYKTQLINADLQRQKDDINKELKDMMDQYNKFSEEYKKLSGAAGDLTLSAEERDRSTAAAAKKLQDMKEQQQMYEGFQNKKRADLETQSQRIRDDLLTQIRAVITARAKAGGFALVVDTAAEARTFTPVVLFTNGENDLTDSVLTELNRGAPAGWKPTEKKETDKPAEKKTEPAKDGGK